MTEFQCIEVVSSIDLNRLVLQIESKEKGRSYKI